MAARKKSAETEREPSRAAGGCVLVVLAGAALAGVFAASTEAGILTLWVVAAGALWRAARKKMPDAANPAPPPGSTPLSEAEEAGHGGVRVERRDGMLVLYDLSEEIHFTVSDGEVNQA
ncbi:hypothetical protein GCM10010293_36770 [Streptomyces griseoflavus]|uniref:hypothetical protein n=1 Tax=Streptomyces griseoflavus TaxID=35619 RepID=UPI00167D4819|nr:hypothetical protein [Streptomyces griseoflavus]GGV34336.1 hypothetical protein GCM10010293_36770 [Streptomyces griseoflavus]